MGGRGSGCGSRARCAGRWGPRQHLGSPRGRCLSPGRAAASSPRGQHEGPRPPVPTRASGLCRLSQGRGAGPGLWPGEGADVGRDRGARDRGNRRPPTHTHPRLTRALCRCSPVVPVARLPPGCAVNSASCWKGAPESVRPAVPSPRRHSGRSADSGRLMAQGAGGSRCASEVWMPATGGSVWGGGQPRACSPRAEAPKHLAVAGGVRGGPRAQRELALPRGHSRCPVHRSSR